MLTPARKRGILSLDETDGKQGRFFSVAATATYDCRAKRPSCARTLNRPSVVRLINGNWYERGVLRF